MLVDPVLAGSAPADLAPPDPVLADPVLADPVLAESEPADLAPPDPVLADPSLDPVPAAGGVLFAGLLLVPPAAGELDVAGAADEELPLTGGATVAVGEGLAVLDGWVELLSQGASVAPAGCLPPAALTLAFAGAGVLAPPAAEVALALPVAAAVVVWVAVAVAL